MNCRTIDLDKFVEGSEDAKILAILLSRNVALHPDTVYLFQVDGRVDSVKLSHAIVSRVRSNHKNLTGDRYSVIGPTVGEGYYGMVVDIVTLSIENGHAKRCNPSKSRVAKIQNHAARKALPEVEAARFENEKQQTLKASYLHAKSPYLIFAQRLEQSVLVMRKFNGPILADIIAADAIVRKWYPSSFVTRIDSYIPKIIELDDRIEYSINLLCALDEQAHSRRVVNLDVKPDNTIVDENTKKMTLIDLGCARNVGEVRPPYFHVGTEGYLAPEVKIGHPQFTCISMIESDLYSAGVSLRNLWGDNNTLFEETETLVDADMERGLTLIPNPELRNIVRMVLISLTILDAQRRMPLNQAIELLKSVQLRLRNNDVLTADFAANKQPDNEPCLPVLGDSDQEAYSPSLKKCK